MNVKNVEKKENNKTAFQVEIDAAAFDIAVNKAYQKNKGEIYIAGFRKGKAPRAVIEGMYGKEVFYQDAMDALAPEAFAFGATEAKLNVVGTPSVEDVNLSEDKVLTFTFSVDIYPEAALGQYKGLELEKSEAVVDDESVDDQIETLRKRNARRVPVEGRAAAMGDTANIDFDGYVDGERFEGGKSEGYELELGSNSFVPGFEDQVVGMNVGEEKDVNITFPEHYNAELAGKAAVFKVKLNALTAPEYPELDDDFAKDVSEFDTFEEYKADVRRGLVESAQAQADSAWRSGLLKLAGDNMTAEIPEVMIDEKITEILRNYAANFGVPANELTREQLEQMLGIDEQTMMFSIRPAAEYQVRTDVLLTAVVKAENIEIGEAEADEYIEKLAGEYKVKPEDLTSYFGREFIINEHKKEKAADIIVENGKNVKGKHLPSSVPAEEAEEEKPAKKTRKSTKKADAEAPAEEKPAKKPAAKKTAKKAEAEAPAEAKPAKKPAAKKTTKKAETAAE